MTSSASAGERRYNSTRRGGMTVLGKVAVPKPLNLPSQRLENHGLDPNVEIVPKGTLSWGTRSSPSATNAWGSSNADNSPSHLSGRPSSGGSGTRPSTAGSDKVNETSGNAWGSTSRPSSASGILSSDQSSGTSLRPDSAEPRPASSQLSRFAEPLSDSQGAWGESGTSERLGPTSSKKDDFSLSSRDFPTLGSEKDQSNNISESKDEMEVAINRLKRDESESVGEGLQPSMERWQAEHHQYFNPNIPPQHFDAWRGPPMNVPPGVWYRGHQGGPPFRPPVGPGGFPIEPFPYYPPQIQPPPFANSHPVPPPRGGPRGHHPKSGNPYRPKMHDAFMHQGMPYGPGFYPPPMHFDSYYGPPRGYCSPNEPDIPFMNMGANHPVYDGRYSVPNALGLNDSHARDGGPGPAGKKSDDVNFYSSGESRISGKFPSEQGEWDVKEQAGNREHMPPALASHPVMGEKTVIKPRKYEWGAEDDGDDDIYSSSHFGGGDNYVPETVRAKASRSSEKLTNDYRNKKVESGSASPLLSTPKELEPPFLSTAKDVTLMRKIEGLNAKVRSDGRIDRSSNGEEQKCGIDATISASMGKNFISEASFSHEVVGPRDNRVVHQTAAPMSRRPYHGMLNRSEHGGKGKFGSQPTDGWKMRPLAAEMHNAVSASKVEVNHNFIERGFQQDLEGAEAHQPSQEEGGFNTKLQDSIGSQAQRAKMREIAKQRAMQLQKEEEERIRDQKAKALAKLEELNRRTQSGDAPSLVAKKSVSSETSKEQQEEKDVEHTESDIKSELTGQVIQLKTEGSLVNDENKKQIVGSEVPVETSKVKVSAETLPLKQQDVVSASIHEGKSSPELDKGFVLNKSTSYKQKQNYTAVKNYNENLVSVDSRKGRRSPPTDTFVKNGPDAASSEVHSINQTYSINSRNNVLQSSIAQRTSSRSSTSRNKQDDAPLVSTALATGSTQTIPSKTARDIVIPQAPTLQLSFGTIQVAVNGESGLEVSDQTSSLPSEDTHGKVSSQLKAQNTRRMPRSQQVNNKLRTNDAAVWAPVCSQTKVDIPGEATAIGDLKEFPESGTSAKSENLAQSSSRSKRAEMERYIPKPVAKELAEQVGMHPKFSSSGASALDMNVQPFGSATTVDPGSSVGSGQGLVKHNKSGKTHGAWQQRAEFSHANNIRQRPSSSDPSKSSLEDVSRNQSNPESDQLQAVTKTSSERISSGSKIASLSSDVPVSEAHHVPKDEVITGKGKSYSDGGHKKSGNGQSNDNTNRNKAESDRSHIQFPCPDIIQSERAITPKESHATSERASSHWQPKAYAHSVSGQKGSRITVNQGGGVETSGVSRKDYPLQQRGKTFPQDKESNDIYGPDGELVPETKAEGSNQPRRGRRPTSSKSSNQNPVDDIELGVAESSDVQHAQQYPGGSRRHGNQVNRSTRGNESHGNLSVQGNRHHERPRHMHYEYQPVGSLDYKKNKFEGQEDGIRNPGSRNRGRGRRGGGNFRVPQGDHLQD